MGEDPTPLEDLSDTIVSQFAALGPVVPVVLGGAIGIALLFWGGPKLIAFFKRVAK